jgi:hypothetical protein
MQTAVIRQVNMGCKFMSDDWSRLYSLCRHGRLRSGDALNLSQASKTASKTKFNVVDGDDLEGACLGTTDLER